MYRYSFLRWVMALPFLQAEVIPQAFSKLEEEAKDEALSEVCVYTSGTWINNAVWPPESWSVFMQWICTNNDVEGWHNRLNRNAGRAGYNSIYPVSLDRLSVTLPILLDQIATISSIKLHKRHHLRQILGLSFAEIQARLVNQENLQRVERRGYHQPNEKILNLRRYHLETFAQSLQQALIYGPVKIN